MSIELLVWVGIVGFGNIGYYYVDCFVDFGVIFVGGFDIQVDVCCCFVEKYDVNIYEEKLELFEEVDVVIIIMLNCFYEEYVVVVFDVGFDVLFEKLLVYLFEFVE